MDPLPLESIDPVLEVHIPDWPDSRNRGESGHWDADQEGGSLPDYSFDLLDILGSVEGESCWWRGNSSLDTRLAEHLAGVG